MGVDVVLFAEFCGAFFEFGLAAGNEDEIMAMSGENASEFIADAAGCAGDESCALHEFACFISEKGKICQQGGNILLSCFKQFIS